MFDSRSFLRDHFVNPAGVLQLLTAYGLRAPSQAAVQKWFARGVVPGVWLPVLAAVEELETGAPVNLSKYLVLGGR